MAAFRRILFFCLFLNLHATLWAQDASAERMFTVQELRSDLLYLKGLLEKVHPDLYMYISKPDLDHVFDSLHESISGPLSGREFFDRIATLHSRIGDGHTMFLPDQTMMDRSSKSGAYLPFYFSLVQGKIQVRLNCSSDTSIPEGAELISLNGVGSSELLEHLMTRQIRDGVNQTYPAWILSNYFKDYYGFSYGYPGSFALGIRSGNEERLAVVRALSRDSIRFYRQLRHPELAVADAGRASIGLVVDSVSGIVTLTIRNFDASKWRADQGRPVERLLEDLFARIRQSGVSQMILDLRDNQGGQFGPGRRLLPYLLNTDLSFLPGTPEASVLKPAEDAFKGKLYVLINGGSFSITGIVCAYLQETGRAVFIGEETAGNRIVLCGSPVSKTLAVTGIQVEVSTRKYVIVPGRNTGHGTLPDHPVDPSFQDILQKRDAVMEYAIRLIKGWK